MRRLLGALACVIVWSAAARALPPGEDGAKARLETSPRHGEMVRVDVAGTPVRTWVVYPERKDKAPVVVVIHEIFGLTDWIRAVADQLAADGFIAVAPDLLSGKGPKGGGTEAYASRDDAMKAVTELGRAEVMARLDGVRAWALGLPAANGRSAAMGFCWGGSQSFAYAFHADGLDAAIVYYGSAPEKLTGGKAHIQGLYGEHDARVNATIEPAHVVLAWRYEPHVFAGAGHGFLRAQGGRDGANLRAAQQAWPLTLEFLHEHMS